MEEEGMAHAGWAGGGAAAAAAIAQAIKASGAIVKVSDRDFAAIVDRTPEPLVVYAQGRFLAPKHQYLTSYRGLIFHATAQTPIPLPGKCEMVIAKKIWIPM
jgi:hypothetical protein